MRPKLSRRLAAGVAACLALACAAGCNYLGAAALIVGGLPKIEAKHELDPERPTVIFIDDRDNAAPRRSLRVSMGLEADQTLIEKKAVNQEAMIASQSALSIATSERQGAPRSIASIGRAVGAEVVIYVELDSFILTRDGMSMEPEVSARVKVLDLTTNQRVWPTDPEGYPLVVKPPVKADMPTTLAERNKAETDIAKYAGLELARLFFTFEKPGATSKREL